MSRPVNSYFPFYYGWVLVGVSLLSLTVAYGIWWSFPVFYVHILRDFGWSRGGTAFIFTVGSVVYGFSSLPAGVLADRLGPRKLLPAACLILASGCLICYAADEKWHFYVAFGVFMGFGTICMGYVPVSAILSNWFVRRRGTAIGIALIGNVAPPLLAFPVQELISRIGWQASYAVLALILLAVIAPLNAFSMRRTPQELGMRPEGFSSPDAGAALSIQSGAHPGIRILDPRWAETDWSLSRSLHTYRFWALAGVMLTSGLGGGIIMHHLVAMVMDRGHTGETAALVFSLAGVMAAGGRISGFLSDRFGREAAFTLVGILNVCSAVSLLIFLAGSRLWPLYLYGITFGLGSGLSSPTITSGAADLFGGKNFGSILGSSNIFYGIGQGIGAWAGGAIFDHTGSYRLAVAAAIPLFAFMTTFFWIMGPRRVRRNALPERTHSSRIPR